MILKKKRSYFEEKQAQNRNKPKEIWKALKSLGLRSNKANKLKTSLNKDGTIQSGALKFANIFKRFYLELARDVQLTLIDDTCTFYLHENVKKNRKCFKNKEFASLCQWFIDNQLLIHFGEDKTKSILFSKAKGLKEINISFAGCTIQQHETVEYLGFQFYSKLSGEAMASKVLKKINAKLKCLYRQNST